jgi:hypothetical protein
MTPQQYRQIIVNLLKIAKTLHDDILTALINKAEADWTGTGMSFEHRAAALLELTAKVIRMESVTVSIVGLEPDDDILPR